MFCFQSLVDTINAAALGYQLDKLDEVLDHAGNCVTLPCYIPDSAQGEDNAQDFLGMAGMPIATTPYFPKGAPTLLLTQSSACDAVVTSGFVAATHERGLKRLTSIRLRGRRVACRDFAVEGWQNRRMTYPHARRDAAFPVMEFRNNATWPLANASRTRKANCSRRLDTFASIKQSPYHATKRQARENDAVYENAGRAIRLRRKQAVHEIFVFHFRKCNISICIPLCLFAFSRTRSCNSWNFVWRKNQ